MRPALPFPSVWTEPYLETCCRSALHRLSLCGNTGRPATEKDRPCLERLNQLGFALDDADGRFRLTPAGSVRHRAEILGEPQARVELSGAELIRG